MSEHCEEALACIDAYLDGRLDSAVIERVRLHLDECPPCHSHYALEERRRIVGIERLAARPPPAIVPVVAFEAGDDPFSSPPDSWDPGDGTAGVREPRRPRPTGGAPGVALPVPNLG